MTVTSISAHSSVLRAINPTTGEVVRELLVDSDDVVDRKIDRAESAAIMWERSTFERRSKILRQIAQRARDGRDRLAALMTEEMGKTVREARGEVDKCAMTADHFAEHGPRYLAREVIESDATLSYVHHLPLGVVLGILPWNAPMWLAFRVAAPAIMAGNAVLIKHDPHVPGCARALGEVFDAPDAPHTLLQPLLIETERVEAVIRDRRVHAVSFTGSTRGGRAVAAIAGSEIKRTVLELGGSDAAIVLADADLDAATEAIALMRIIATGQSCIAAKRIIVEAPVYDEMVERLHAKLASLHVGDPTSPDTDVGPMARADLRAELHRQVTETVEQGARCVLGGVLPTGPGCFYPVTLLADVTPKMTAFREETFGPVAVMTRAETAKEAVNLANDSDYGLGGSVWTASAERGEAIAATLFTGQVAVNGLVKTDPRLPSGGIKCSGYGKELGPQGIREFVNSQQVWVGPKRS